MLTPIMFGGISTLSINFSQVVVMRQALANYFLSGFLPSPVGDGGRANWFSVMPIGRLSETRNVWFVTPLCGDVIDGKGVSTSFGVIVR